ncbi:MAG: hypothetical protein IJN32_07925 [Thermoguttaceae bacterium]|nr:hypothetical protein [Thermoguttaceae bacterium]
MAAIKTITTKIIMGRDGVFEIDDTKVPGIVSVSLTYQRELVDVTTRDDGGWTKKYPGVKSATAEVELFRIEGDATQDLFWLSAARKNSAALACRILSKKDCRGLSGDWVVSNIAEDQGKDGAATHKISLENFGELEEISSTAPTSF